MQHFTVGRIRSLLRSRGFRVECRRNGSWFGGDLTYFLFYFAPRLVPASLRVADVLPAQLVSTWYFSAAAPTSPIRELASTSVAPRTGNTGLQGGSNRAVDDRSLRFGCRGG